MVSQEFWCANYEAVCKTTIGKYDNVKQSTKQSKDKCVIFGGKGGVICGPKDYFKQSKKIIRALSDEISNNIVDIIINFSTMVNFIIILLSAFMLIFLAHGIECNFQLSGLVKLGAVLLVKLNGIFFGKLYLLAHFCFAPMGC